MQSSGHGAGLLVDLSEYRFDRFKAGRPPSKIIADHRQIL
jgi:hypothetical protein